MSDDKGFGCYSDQSYNYQAVTTEIDKKTVVIGAAIETSHDLVLYQKTAPTSLAGTFKVPEDSRPLCLWRYCADQRKNRSQSQEYPDRVPAVANGRGGGRNCGRRQRRSSSRGEATETACWQQGSPRLLRAGTLDRHETDAGRTRREGSRRQEW